jgi:hypothetical protein
MPDVGARVFEYHKAVRVAAILSGSIGDHIPCSGGVADFAFGSTCETTG